ncbi:anoctamin-1-like, partial [Thraustotheca clavata]
MTVYKNFKPHLFNIQQSFQQRLFIWFNKTKAGVENNIKSLTIESGFYLSEYGWREMFDYYMIFILQVGFTVFFAAAFPLASFLSLFDNIFKIRVNSYRLLTLYRRPKPQHASTMGIWMTVLDTLAVLSVITNSFII